MLLRKVSPRPVVELAGARLLSGACARRAGFLLAAMALAGAVGTATLRFVATMDVGNRPISAYSAASPSRGRRSSWALRATLVSHADFRDGDLDVPSVGPHRFPAILGTSTSTRSLRLSADVNVVARLGQGLLTGVYS